MKFNFLTVGVIGTIITALCCFTPVLVILFSLFGLSAIAVYLDFILLPALVFFVIITGYALWKRQKCHLK
ncbi:mercury resistance system transport protein MerF [Kiloniella sp.]|uniref:mercury resistance system transport protein MerF n=1 Tax=Kiloniella sp. TaxID=1938587 RepID=UPI003A941142